MNKLSDIAGAAGLDPREWYLFELVSPSGTVIDSGYETPRRALQAASDTGTTARVVIPGYGTFPVELSR